jgi:hypothetical protein
MVIGVPSQSHLGRKHPQEQRGSLSVLAGNLRDQEATTVALRSSWHPWHQVLSQSTGYPAQGTMTPC